MTCKLTHEIERRGYLTIHKVIEDFCEYYSKKEEPMLPINATLSTRSQQLFIWLLT